VEEEDGQGRMDNAAADTDNIAVPNHRNTYCCNCMYDDCSVQVTRSGRGDVVDGNVGNDADDRAMKQQLQKVALKLVVD
jgi:hypothetical protein